MAQESGTIRIIRGDDELLQVTFTDENGSPIDLTGSTVFFTVKKKSDLSQDNDDLAVISITVTSHSDPTNGITEIPMTKTETNLDKGDYYWDLQIKDTADDISSVVKGIFEIIEDVTKRIV